ncbi:Transcription elongation factor SPT6 [Sparganum proliferum]
MSDFRDSEASEASEDEGREKKYANENKADLSVSSDSEEEEEIPDEEEICRKEGKGWIVNDDEEEEEGGSDSEEGSNASEKSLEEEGGDDDDDLLDDEDLELIRENVGIDIQRKKKKRRLRRDKDDGAEISSKRALRDDHGREEIAKQIFEETEDDVEDNSARAAPSFTAKSDDEGEESDDPALQQAQDIFGVDFDFEEFEQYDQDRPSDVSSASDDYEYDDDDTSVARMGKRKRAAKAAAQDKVYELFDPSDLARAFYSPQDERIRCTDLPERCQLRAVPIRRLDPQSASYEADLIEVEKEAEWIYNVAFREGPSKKPPAVTDKIFQVLKLLKESLSEVPFITFYRKEYIEKDLNINDLWRIYEYDEKWETLQQRRKGLIRQLEKMHSYFESIPADSPNSADKKHASSLINLIALAQNAISLEEVHDVRLNYLLHYAAHADIMQAAEKKDSQRESRSASESKQQSLNKNADLDNDPEDEEADDPTFRPKIPDDEDDGGESEGHQKDELEASGEVTDKASETPGVTTTVDPLTGRRIRQRQVRTTAAYEVAQRAGIAGLVQRFGLTAAQFADNVRDQYLRHEVDQCPMLPVDAAADFVCPQFPTPASALCAARYMLAFQISREPVVRQLARRMLYTQALISLSPTSKGFKLIDEGHPLFSVKYLRNKPVLDLMGDVLYLHIHNGARDRLVQFHLHMPENQLRGLCLLDDLRHFFHQDEFSSLVEAWNEQRSLLLKEAVEQFLQPHIFKELQEKLLESSQQAVMKLCAQKLFKCLKVAPYTTDDHRSLYPDDDTASTSGRGRSSHSGGGSSGGSVWPKPARVLAFAIKEDTKVMHSIVSAVQLDADGEVTDFLHLPALLSSGKSQREDLKNQRAQDIRRLSAFISHHRPQAVVIGCNSRNALTLRQDIQQLIEDLPSESRLSRLNIELMDTELAVVYAQSSQASSDLPSSYSTVLKQAISLGRKLQDPLAEFAQLFNTDAEILGVRWHPIQDSVPRELLLKALEIEFINRTNEVGVDINRCLLHPHTANLLQFVAGLGPRKALYMLKLLKQKKLFLTNRVQLARILGLGPHVAINCAGFIKIDSSVARDLGGDNIEILDSTRVHPESYDLAKQMAKDALEYDDTDDNNPSAALEEIVQSPARLRELDLDAFAEELKRQGHGDKHITLYDIRKELNHRYRDLRFPFEPLTAEQIFSLTTHETPETLHVGRLVECQVLGVATRKPRPEQLDKANPTKNELTGLWMCPFCKQDDFQKLDEMWAHFDSNDCPGQVVGLRLQLENGISGFIPLRLTDPPTERVLEQAQPGTILQARVTKIDITKYNVELTLKASDIQDERHLWTPRKDPFYDYEAEEAEIRKEEAEKEKAKASAHQAYINRLIFHPHFKNISYSQLVAMEPQLEVGAIIIRPSRQGTDHLTVSLKVDDGILKHFDVIEKDKTQSFALGRTLLIGNEEFEDLDEIVARFMQPMVYLIREVMTHKYYRDSRGGIREVLTELLRKEKEISPNRIPYFLSSMAEHPGCFLLAYMPNQRARFEVFSVKPEGFKFRRLMFPSLDRLIGWFKEHYNEAASGGMVSHTRATDLPAQSPMVFRTPQINDTYSRSIPYGGM